MINWELIWAEFDKWYMKQRDKKGKPCKTCKRVGSSDPEWSDQKKALQHIVDKYLRKEKKK